MRLLGKRLFNNIDRCHLRTAFHSPHVALRRFWNYRGTGYIRRTPAFRKPRAARALSSDRFVDRRPRRGWRRRRARGHRHPAYGRSTPARVRTGAIAIKQIKPRGDTVTSCDCRHIRNCRMHVAELVSASRIACKVRVNTRTFETVKPLISYLARFRAKLH